ncbi:MAG: hypothetical protein ABIU54_02215 [Candidatus Eisenbacteria bacterium]
MEPKDITGRVMRRPLHSPYMPGHSRSNKRRWFWILIGAWALWAVVMSDQSLWRIAQLKRDLASAKSETQRIQLETQALDERSASPRAKQEHAEALQRRNGWAMPGEIIYRFRNGAARDSSRR